MESADTPSTLFGFRIKNRFARALFCLLVALFAILLFFVSKLIVNTLFSVVAKWRFQTSDEVVKRLLLENSSALGIFGGLLALIIAVVIIYFLRRSPKTVLGIKPFSLLSLIPCVMLGIIFNLFADSLLSVIPFPESYLEQFRETYSFLGAGNVVLEVICVVIVTPVVEELFFRALSYGALRRGMPVILANLVSAAIFGAAHGNLLSFSFTFVLGIFLACIYEKSGSLPATILVHASFNAASYMAPGVISGIKGAYIYLFIAAGAAGTALSFYFACRPYLKKKEVAAEAAIGEDK